MDYIYAVKSYENRRCYIPHTIMYFKNIEHTYWAFNKCPNNRDILKVEVEYVDINSKEYEMALSCSKKAEENKNN